MRIKADFKYRIQLQNRRKYFEKNWEYEEEKNERKKLAYIRKKEEEYKRKMLNEIREIQNKPKKVYKTEWPKIKPIQFAMQIAQENARLRDTDENGRWPCISHESNAIFPREALAWWHRFSRRFNNICLEPENINAQCHTCNRITWPLWNPSLKLKTNEKYSENMDKKWGEWTSERLRLLTRDFAMWKGVHYDLKKKIPQLIKENEKLWKTKSKEFLETHKPARKRKHLWEEYCKRH